MIQQMKRFVRNRLPGPSRRRADYRAVFCDIEEGRRVLHDLARVCGFLRPSHQGGGGEQTAFNDGMRNVILYILHQIDEPGDMTEFLDEHRRARQDYFNQQETHDA